MKYQRGDRIRFLLGPMGLLANIDDLRFVEETVKEGDEGIYQGPHPTIEEADWHVVQFREWVCPVHDSMIEKIE